MPYVVNLKTKYADKLAKAFDFASVISGKTSNEYRFDGAKGIQIIALKTQALNDYNRNATSNRYGTPSELEDYEQEMTLDKDRSFSIPVDKGNFIEGNRLKTAGSLIADEFNEIVGPEMEQDFFKRLCLEPGVVYSTATAISASNIIGRLAAIEAAFTNARAPKQDRFVAVPTTVLQLFRQSLTNCDHVTDKLLMQGIVGKFGTLNVLEVPDSDLPSGVNLIAWSRKAVIFAKTIEDLDLHQKPQGISGILVEGRYRWGGGVIKKYCKAVYVDTLAAGQSGSSQQAAPSVANTGTISNLQGADYVMYTIDGSDPRTSWTAKKVTTTGAVTHTSGDVLKAAGYKAGKVVSEVASVTTTS